MRIRNALLTAAVALPLAALSAGAALASDDGNCAYAPRDQWKTTDEAKAAIEAQGYTVVRIKTDDNCYEAYARDEKGGRHEIYLDPTTLTIVSKKYDD